MPSTLPRPHHLHAQSLLCSESVVLRGGAVFLESPQLGLQSSLLCTCPRREAWPGRGLGAALLPAGGALMVLGAGGAPGSTPSTPPAVLRGRTGLEPGPLEAGPSELAKSRLSGREGRLCPPQPAARGSASGCGSGPRHPPPTPVPSAALADWVERTCENLPGVPTPPPVTSPPSSPLRQHLRVHTPGGRAQGEARMHFVS